MAFFITCPHAGERVPEEAGWLKGLPERLLMCDVDRYVDLLYEPVADEFKIPFIKTEWHRYSGDLNRFPEDVDASTVKGNKNPAGTFRRGFLWQITTTNLVLMKEPIDPSVHKALTEKYFQPFHEKVKAQFDRFHKAGAKTIYHLDAHSMPSVGTKEHKDPGETRADIVVSDCFGKSCSTAFKDLVMEAYQKAGFKVGYNWPYQGGRVTETYGHPELGHHTIQVEMSRAQYMDEESKALLPKAEAIRLKIRAAIGYIRERIETLKV